MLSKRKTKDNVFTNKGFVLPKADKSDQAQKSTDGSCSLSAALKNDLKRNKRRFNF